MTSGAPALFEKNAPIGIFDSGVGGLSIWREVAALLPAERIVYYADSAYCPYGVRTQEEVIGLCDRICRFFLNGKKCKLIVVACNTATGLAIDHLRATHAVPFVGIEPGVKPAALSSRTGVVGVLATAGTFKGRLYNETKARFAGNVKVIAEEGAGLVELVEQGRQGTPEVEQCLRRHIEPMLAQNIDHLVLGCTHYPFLADDIRRITGDGVKLITSGEAVARRTRFLLEQRGLLNDAALDAGKDAQYAFYTSAQTAVLARMIGQLGIRTNLETLPLEFSATRA